MAEPTKEMIVAAQKVAIEDASRAFIANPTPVHWKQLETEMWAWQRAKQMTEADLLCLLKPVGIGDWSKALEDYSKRQVYS